MSERNDCHGDEETLELLRKRPVRDPDYDKEEYSNWIREELKRAATPEMDDSAERVADMRSAAA